ncbi:hypothetical protein FSP39_011353 [Pinctada imbricata]|uniref:Uncharacterized protein n=1 Tax=Pinctada imbricata TaxID=66713 RepID=A0AA88Y447_PINIB|nr:hypothetical protein FSP39_011353 [Pinctada imbricata]
MAKSRIQVELLGFVYTISKSCLPTDDTSRLAELFQSHETQKTFRFHRSRDAFEAILKYFETGNLHIPKNVCPREFMTEMEFWKIDIKKMCKCCKRKILIHMHDANNIENYLRKETNRESAYQTLQKISRVEITRNCLSDVLEQRGNSTFAKIYHGILTLMVLASVFLIALSSLPELRTAIALPDAKNVSTAPKQIKDHDENPKSISFACSTKTFKTCIDIENHMMRWQKMICKAFDKTFPNASDVDKFDLLTNVYDFCMMASIEIFLPIDPSYGDNFVSGINEDGECDQKFCSKWNSWDNATKQIYSKCNDVVTNTMKVPQHLVQRVFKFCTKISFRMKVQNILLHTEATIQRLANVKILIENNNSHLLYFEFILSAFFTFEYFTRFLCCKAKLRFLILPLNMIDLFALLAGYLRYALYYFGLDISIVDFDILLYLQMFRIFRLFRPLQNVLAFRIFIYSLQKGKHELFLIFLFTFIGMVVFSNLLYFVEDDSQFHSIPEAWWWSIVTMTTVGYGDIYPATVAGKVIGGACAVYGMSISSKEDLNGHGENSLQDSKLYLDLLGITYAIPKDIIPTDDTSRISEMFQEADTLSLVTLHRSRAPFEAILQYFVTGELHIPKSVCPGEFKTEMEFWKIDLKKLSKCCRLKMIIHQQNIRNMEAYSKRKNDKTREENIQNKQNLSRFLNLRTWLSEMFNHRSDVISAKVYRLLLTFMVLVSVLLIAFSSLPEVRKTTALPEVKDDQSDQSSVNRPFKRSKRDTQLLVQNNFSYTKTELQKSENASESTDLFDSFGDIDTQNESPCSERRFVNCSDIKTFMHKNRNGICDAFNELLQNLSTPVNETDILFGIILNFCLEKIDLTTALPPEVRHLADDNLYLNRNKTEYKCGKFFCSVWESWKNTTSIMSSRCEVQTNLESTRKLCDMISNAIVPDVFIISERFNTWVAIQEIFPEKLPSIKTLIESNNSELLYFEFILSAFFTVDYFVRFSCSHRKLLFLISPLNVVDLLALVAGYLRYILYSLDVGMNAENFDFLLYLQIFRIFRLFRPLQSVCAFRIFVYSLRKGKSELFLITLFTLIGMIVFSNLLYFVENESKIKTIPEAWWWSIVTMTTVGYGDFYPVTALGKIIGGVCALYGVIIYALTIPMFVNTFNAIYRYELVERQIEESKSNTPKDKIECKGTSV